MPIRPGSIQEVAWRETGTADAFVTAGAALLDIPSVEIADDEVGTALYLSRAAANRKTFSIPVHDWSLFAALNTLQLARKGIELRITLTNGDIFTYDPVSFTATPILGAIPHIGEVWVDASTADITVTAPPGGTWVSVGSIQAGSTAEFTAQSGSNGYGLPFYKHMRLRHEMQLLSDAAVDPATTLAAYENIICHVAITHPDGTFTGYENVYSEVRNNPEFSEEGFVGLRWRLDAVQEDFNSIVKFTGTPPDYVFGFTIEGSAFGYAESDILTIT